MEKCPNEILLNVFRLACDDDGTTGRSLSLVSKHIHLLSKEYKLQSIAIVGIAQILSFTLLLGAIPARYRRVRHLFTSTVPQTRVMVNKQNYQCTSKITHQIPIERHYVEVCAAFSQILQYVSPTLKTFRAVSPVPRAVSLISVSCPNLVELTLQGPFPAMLYPHEAPFFPALRHLNLYSFNDHPMYLFEDISTQAPSITHLSLFPAQPSRSLHGHLFSALDIEIPRPRSGHSSNESVSFGVLPPTVTAIFVEPGPQPESDSRNSSCLKNVQEIMKKKLLYMQKHDKLQRLKYVPPGRPRIYEKALLEWLEDRKSMDW